jgi:hypothetical protein
VGKDEVADCRGREEAGECENVGNGVYVLVFLGEWEETLREGCSGSWWYERTEGVADVSLCFFIGNSQAG